MRRASKPDLSSRECRASSNRALTVWPLRMQNNKDAGQQDDDKLQPRDSCGRCWGEIVSIVLDVSRHQLERYNITGAEAMGQAGSGRQRSGEVDRRRYAGIGKNGNMPAWDRLPLGSLIASNYQPRTQGQQLRNLAGKMVKNTEILGEFRRTLSRFSAAN
jgi:hypothetical protein